MKKVVSFLLVLMMVLSITLVSLAEEKPTLSVYFGNESLNKTMVTKFAELHPEINVEHITSDTASAEQVLKTGISAGDAPNVCSYWGTRVNTFYDIGMCKDLRDYLSEETLAKVSPTMQGVATGENGEIYAIPYDAVYHVMFYNKDMMTEYGFEEPKTWDDLTAIFAKLKEDNIFGFCTNSVSMQDCMYGLTYSLLEEIAPGTSLGVASGEVSVLPGTEAGDAISKVINQVKEWYDAGYWYPGDGGISCSADDANAAFAQGRTMFIFNFSGALSTHAGNCDFEIGWQMKPVSEDGMTSYENIEPNVFFIPSNTDEEHSKLAASFLEYVLSQDIQQEVVNAFYIPSVTGYEYKDISTISQEMFVTLDSGNIIPGINPTRTSSAMQIFVKQQVFAAPCGGIMTVDETLEEMERIRLESIQ
ncbi:MAG: extracellular solute-binding protein [Clostridiales bacterium]|nr:extracellular solute-binding protein [Clostridiales bacterium]